MGNTIDYIKRFKSISDDITDLNIIQKESDKYDNNDDLLKFTNYYQNTIGYEESSLYRYLLCCAVLANDYVELRNYLFEVRTLNRKGLWISREEIAYHENQLHNGICNNAFYQKLFNDAIEKRNLTRLVLETNGSIEYINLLELACILKPTYESTNVIEVILIFSTHIFEKELESIICNPCIDVETSQVLIGFVTERKDYFKVICVTSSMLPSSFEGILFNLCNSYIKGLFTERSLILSKLCLLFDQIGYHIGTLTEFMLNAIIASHSALLLCCLNHIYLRRRYYGFSRCDIDSLKQTLNRACNHQEYYMVNLIVKLFKPQIKEAIIFNQSYNFDLFLVNYLLQHELIDFSDFRRSPYILDKHFHKLVVPLHVHIHVNKILRDDHI